MHVYSGQSDKQVSRWSVGNAPSDLDEASSASAEATACRSNDTSSLVANFASWFSLSLARLKKRPFVHSAALGRGTAARRRAAIRSTAVAAAPPSAVRAVHPAHAPPAIFYRGSR